MGQAGKEQVALIYSVTEQCGALSQSNGLGLLIFAKSSLQAKAKITLDCIIFLHAILKIILTNINITIIKNANIQEGPVVWSP